MESDEECLGIQLSYLWSEEFLNQIHSIDLHFPDFTTEDVCERIIKPNTHCSQSSWCKQNQNEAFVGKPTVFVSHAWKNNFKEVCETLKNQFHNQPNTFIWFDIFSCNQHNKNVKDFTWWSETFKKMIQDINHTVIILLPWKDPIPLKRAWCLWELYCSSDNHRLDVAISLEERDNFIRSVSENTRGEINDMLASIDLEESQCEDDNDREKIFQAVRETTTISALNSKVISKLRKWVIKVVEEQKDTILHKLQPLQLSDEEFVDTQRQYLRIENVLATLYDREEGRDMHTKAVALFEENLQQRAKLLGYDDPDTWAID